MATGRLEEIKKNKASLHKIKVLDLSRLLPGPLCSMILADHGADVLAIEDRRYKKENQFVQALYRNKKHMTLNLKDKTGRQVFLKLVKEADVVIEGFRPGVVQNLNISYKDLLKVNRKIIYCSISGYGQTGSMKVIAGHDVNYLSLTGLLDLMGSANQPPAIPGIQVADIVGSLNAVAGILLALFHRQQTGQGQYIDISITDSLSCFFPVLEFFRQQTNCFPQRSNTMLSHRYACYNTYETKDGRYLAVGAVEHSFWKEICLALELPEMIPLQYDEKHRQQVKEKLQTIFLSKPLLHWEEMFKDLDVCVSPVKTLDEAVQTKLFKERQILMKDEKENFIQGIPIKLSQTPGRVASLPVDFGQSTTQILGDLGYSQEQIQDMYDQGII